MAAPSATLARRSCRSPAGRERRPPRLRQAGPHTDNSHKTQDPTPIPPLAPGARRPASSRAHPSGENGRRGVWLPVCGCRAPPVLPTQSGTCWDRRGLPRRPEGPARLRRLRAALVTALPSHDRSARAGIGRSMGDPPPAPDQPAGPPAHQPTSPPVWHGRRGAGWVMPFPARSILRNLEMAARPTLYALAWRTDPPRRLQSAAGSGVARRNGLAPLGIGRDMADARGPAGRST